MAYFAASNKNITAVGSGSFVCDRLLLVTVNTGGAGAVLKIYDGTSSSGTLIATIDASSRGTLTYAVRTSSHNLFWQLSTAAADITLVYD